MKIQWERTTLLPRQPAAESTDRATEERPLAPSASFETFVRSVRDGGSSRERHESYDLQALAALDADELVQAEDLLLERLADRTEDPRMVPALLQIGPSPRGLKAMQDALSAYPKNRTGVALALALWRLNQDDAALEKLIATATKSGRPDRRMAAINALGSVPHPQADATLLYAIQNDEDDLIPTAAESALLEKYGLDKYRSHPLILRLTRELSDADLTRREAALTAFSDLITAVRQGINPADLGLSR